MYNRLVKSNVGLVVTSQCLDANTLCLSKMSLSEHFVYSKPRSAEQRHTFVSKREYRCAKCRRPAAAAGCGDAGRPGVVPGTARNDADGPLR